ncbi:hypothetical protein BD311DRAFT_33131 [Dichomitus squalens]|uniref:Uncharacterized protein n=1 Tax=Dichomitus squalens TaxID=114155 RepID=A0A4Q9N012_9APHY|nr:hypothetical protein BD311DRAFT_33131 [Dichomitus squalens]
MSAATSTPSMIVFPWTSVDRTACTSIMTIRAQSGLPSRTDAGATSRPPVSAPRGPPRTDDSQYQACRMVE